jgi:hypothetical protein
MDWTMVAVYLFCAVFMLYVAGLLRGFYYELTHNRPEVSAPEKPKSLA